MTVLQELLHDRVGLDDAAVEHLQQLLADWQILADLSFADLLLWVSYDDPSGVPSYLCVGQMRPYTAQTVYTDDQVGRVYEVAQRPMVGRAFSERRVIRDADPDWSTGVPVRAEAIPVRLADRIVAVVTREANVSTARAPSQLELTYLQSAGELAQMVADGTFPYPGGTHEREDSPRVGDGIMRMDADGVVTYASPNAISAYRRLGRLDRLVGQNPFQFDPEAVELTGALHDGYPVDSEIEQHGVVTLRRMLPLTAEGETIGALLLVREVTELRRHERALRVKDATIREIHHRVKNNLQTVASLLRLQSRRLRSDEARDALMESERRITSIALVHETLSQESRQRVHFAKVARRIFEMLTEGLMSSDADIAIEMEGDPGELRAEVATPLALVLTELVQNSLEHAFPSDDGVRRGQIRVCFERGPSTLGINVNDDGVGMPDGSSLSELANLGLQIARTLVESELGGTFSASSPQEGTAIELLIPLP